MAHLNAAILFMLDISESCGYTIEQQIELFNSIKPLFVAKPLVICLTKIDLQKFESLDKDEKKRIDQLAKASNAYLIQMSNITKQGIENVKEKACDILLDHRLTQKAKDPKKAEAILNRLHIAEPKKRDNQDRPAIVPDSVHQGIKKQGPTIIELQEEFGGAGNFHIPIEEHYMLEKEEWRYDKFPEFYNGSNVLDFYDPDITKKLNELEREEAEILKVENIQDELMEYEEVDGVTMTELKTSLKEVRNKKALAKMNHKLKLKNRVVQKTVNLSETIADLQNKGFDVDTERLRSRSKVRRSIKDIEDGRDRVAGYALEDDSDDDEVIDDDDVAMAENKGRGRKTKKRLRHEVSDGSDIDMEGKKAVKGRTLTPQQRHLTAQKRARTLTQERREGTVPKRLPDKPVPESHVRLA